MATPVSAPMSAPINTFGIPVYAVPYEACELLSLRAVPHFGEYGMLLNRTAVQHHLPNQHHEHIQNATTAPHITESI